MLLPKEISDTSERQVVTHDYFVPNFSMLELIEDLRHLEFSVSNKTYGIFS